jgi:two-component SAPR family response regulator
MSRHQTGPGPAGTAASDDEAFRLRRAARNKWVELEKRRILIVEDEALQALHLAQMISEMGATIAGVATSVRSALAEISAKKFDCVTLDVNMDGFLTLGMAKGLRDMQIPYIYCTAYGHVVEETVEVPIVRKPVTQEALADALIKAIGSKA